MTQTDTQVTLTPAEYQKLVKSVEYRKLYNKRPDVVAKRKVYMAKRAAEQKEALKLFREAQTNPEKAVALGIGTRVALVNVWTCTSCAAVNYYKGQPCLCGGKEPQHPLRDEMYNYLDNYNVTRTTTKSHVINTLVTRFGLSETYANVVLEMWFADTL